MTRCWFCGEEMIWQSDCTYEDCGLEGNGIVATLLCPNCNTTADFYLNTDDEKVKE